MSNLDTLVRGRKGGTMPDTDENWDRLKAEIDKDKQIAAVYLLDYAALLKDYRETKAEFLMRSRTGGERVGGKSNLPGSTTERAAINSATYDERQDGYYWLKAVRVVECGLSDRKKLFLEARRQVEARNKNARGHKAWVCATQFKFIDKIKGCDIDSGAWVSERTVQTYWADIVGRVVEIHTRLVLEKYGSRNNPKKN